MMHSGPYKPPLVMHVIRRLATGGMENGLVNLINHMPADAYRHSIVCLTESTEFSRRIRRDDVPVISLHMREGHDLTLYTRLGRLFRRFRPAIVHSRNLAGLDAVIPAAVAGIRGRIHGEHGRDIYDLDGMSPKYRLWRIALKPLVHRYIAVSKDLAHWLVHGISVSRNRVAQIYNGVDVDTFHPGSSATVGSAPLGFATPGAMVVGTVGRLEAVKNQLTLVRAFVHLLYMHPATRQRVRLLIVGEGSLRAEAVEILRSANAEKLAWFTGERTDVPELLRSMNLFVLPSIAEGISNTVLEAMATGLPVVATRVGGNPEVVTEGETGFLVAPGNPVALARAIATYLGQPELLNSHGSAGRNRAKQYFSMEAMVEGYMRVYDSVLRRSKASRKETTRREQVVETHSSFVSPS